MPDGVVQWLDTSSGRAAVVRAARVFPARLADVEPAARHAGAHVHFDIDRDGEVDRAVSVSLRHGTRVSPRHRRFGEGVGAHDPGSRGAAPFARPHPDLGVSLTSHPMEVAAAWARCVQEGDVDSALLLYAPDAVVHDGDGDMAGSSRLHRWLNGLDRAQVGGSPEVKGNQGDVIVTWAAAGEAPRLRVLCRIERGLLCEQWVEHSPAEAGPVTVPVAGGAVEISVSTGYGADQDDVAYALDQLEPLLHRLGAPVLFARLKLSLAPDPARARPAMAQLSLDLNGEVVRAQVAAQQMREAVDLLVRRMSDRLEHRAQRREALHQRGNGGEPGEWRHGDEVALRPDYFDRPPEARDVVRHKILSVEEETPDEAVFDMEMADYDFFLFRDLASGQDALVEAGSEGAYRLTRLEPVDLDGGPSAYPFVVSAQAPPELSVDEAIERLDTGGEQRVFFANATTGRGSVVYRRYDGHYGLISTE